MNDENHQIDKEQATVNEISKRISQVMLAVSMTIDDVKLSRVEIERMANDAELIKCFEAMFLQIFKADNTEQLVERLMYASAMIMLEKFEAIIDKIA